MFSIDRAASSNGYRISILRWQSRAAAQTRAETETGDVTIAKGAVKWFDATRGFDFIQPDGGSNLFVHKSALERAGVSSLDYGKKVAFDLVTGRDGHRSATSIVLAD